MNFLAKYYSMAWHTTRASLIIHMGGFTLLLYLGIWALIAALRWSDDTGDLNEGILTIAMFPSLFWWVVVSGRLLKILRDAEKLLLPAPIKAVVSAFVLQAILTIFIPSVLCALCGIDFFYAIASFSIVAMGGLLLTLLPSFLSILIMLMPNFLRTLHENQLAPSVGSAEYPTFLFMLATAMMLLAVWRIYRLRNYNGSMNVWLTPTALFPDVRSGWGRPGLVEGQSIAIGLGLNPAIEQANLSSPKLALRSYLGAPFMPLTLGGQIKQILILVIIYIVLPLSFVLTESKHAGNDISMLSMMSIFWLAFSGLAITFGGIIIRLQQLYSKDNTELAELALVPGWKNTQAARDLLLKVIAEKAVRGLLIPAVITFIAVAALKTGGNTSYFILFMQYIVFILMGAAFSLNIITGEKTWAGLAGIICIIFFIFSLIQFLYSLASTSFVWNAFIIIGWLFFLLFSSLYLYFSLQVFKNCEHPFLRN
jgi:hypothetical protein